MKLRLPICATLMFGSLAVSPAVAQLNVGPLVDSTLPFTYNRGRNVSVLERERPEYKQLGTKLGGFTLLPSLETRVGYSSNVYQSQQDKVGDGFFVINPSLTLRSDWSRHALRVDTGARLLRYFNETDRNENGWYVGSSGKYELSSDASINLAGRTARQYESRFSSAALNDIRQANPYQITTGRALGDFRFSRSRLLIAGDVTKLDFHTVDTFGGGTLNQDNRDRVILAGTAHYEYGLTPSTGVFGEVTYTRTDYDQLLTVGVANRDSKEWRGVVGLSFDLTALVRGSFSAGYVRRQFDSPLYRDVAGLSLAGRIEYFPTELTTVTLSLGRTVEDATVVGSSGYFNNNVGLRVDHELLRNFLLNAAVDYEQDDYFGVPGKVKIFRAGGGGRYYINNMFSLTSGVTYAKRSSSVPGIGTNLDEVRGTVGVIVQR